MARTVRVKSFELVAKDINDVDVKLLHALSTGVGWPHRPTHLTSPRCARHTHAMAGPEASISSFADRGEFHLFLTLAV